MRTRSYRHDGLCWAALAASLAASNACMQPTTRSASALDASPTSGPATSSSGTLRYEVITLDDTAPPATIHLLYRASTLARRPVILMLGSLDPDAPPDWSVNLLADGYMLAAFTVAYPPDPDPARRPQWLVFDQRFAHGYALGGRRAVTDTRRVIDYLVARGDVNPDKIGWLGSSSTGIPGLAVATRGPRLAAVVAFVSTGAYRQWFETWHTNGLWKGASNDLWPETEQLLRQYDPMLHARDLYPTAVLLVCGGDDKIVDPATTRAFVNAARPAYARDPDRLRLVVYEGFGHNLPIDVVRLYAEHWFRLYMHPTNPPPAAPPPPTGLDDSVRRTQINAADHKDTTGSR